MTGVSEARLFLTWIGPGGGPAATCTSHRVSPLSASRHVTSQRTCSTGNSVRSPPKNRPLRASSSGVSLTAVVTNTRPPSTIGDDQPRPSSSATQRTFFRELHVVGRRESSAAIPRAPGPRKQGQESAVCTGAAETTHAANNGTHNKDQIRAQIREQDRRALINMEQCLDRTGPRSTGFERELPASTGPAARINPYP